MRDLEVNLLLYSACVQIRELYPVWSIPFSHTCTITYILALTYTYMTDIKELNKFLRSEFRND